MIDEEYVIYLTKGIQELVEINEALTADNARLQADKDGLQAQIASLLNLCDSWDREGADVQNGGFTMHAYGMSPDWYVEAAFWSCYGFSPNDPRATLTGKEPSHEG